MSLMKQIDADILALLPSAKSPVRWTTTSQVFEQLKTKGLDMGHRKTVLRRLQKLVGDGLVECRESGRIWEWQRTLDKPRDVPFDEALALKVLQTYASSLLPEQVSTSLVRLFEAADRRLKAGAALEGKHHSRWREKVAVAENYFKLHQPSVKPDVFGAVSQALFRERLLDVQYRSRARQGSEQKCLRPIGLVQQGELHYLVALGKADAKPKMYRLDRIDAAQMRPEGFTYPAGFSLDSYVKTQRQFDFLPLGEKRVTLKFSKDVAHFLSESKIADDQVIHDETGNEIIVSATVLLTERFYWWVRSFGPGVEVVAPPELRDEFARESAATAAHYT